VIETDFSSFRVPLSADDPGISSFVRILKIKRESRIFAIDEKSGEG
jgi:hypothetical protein